MKSVKIIVISFLCMLLLTTNIFAAESDDSITELGPHKITESTPKPETDSSTLDDIMKEEHKESGIKDKSQIGETLETGKNWTDTGKNHATGTMDSEQLTDASSRLYYMLLAVATVVALIAGVMLGIKYMTAGIEEKVQVKESLLPYIVSCIIVFGSLGIWRLMISILGNL